MMESRSAEATASLQQQEEVSIETSLANDRKTIEELRKNIPAEKRQENDQLKEILSLMGEVKDHPSKIRDRFNRVTQRMRQDQRKASSRARSDYNRIEKKNREEFFRKLKEEREDFKSNKASREESKRFYDEQNRIRREYTSDERDRRSQFNADNKAQGDDFNAMMREKNREFTAELRAYTQRYNDYQKELKNKKNAPVSAVPSTMAPSYATPLKTGDTTSPKTGDTGQ
ncbi:MAG: hypothetical protein KDD38_00290 [Bdellovibrionales bacterium]|nr:hypothetical protein [Bdellovibrionales bacterium]